MGRSSYCSTVRTGGMKRKGPWTSEEDALLSSYIKANGVDGCWRNLPKKAGLLRSGKSCRLRWINYLRPDVKRGDISPEEEDLIIRLHKLIGNRWSLIAGRLPGRTDNEIKNYWKCHLKKRFATESNNVSNKRSKNMEDTTSSVNIRIPEKNVIVGETPSNPQPQVLLMNPSHDNTIIEDEDLAQCMQLLQETSQPSAMEVSSAMDSQTSCSEPHDDPSQSPYFNLGSEGVDNSTNLIDFFLLNDFPAHEWRNERQSNNYGCPHPLGRFNVQEDFLYFKSIHEGNLLDCLSN